MVHAFLISRMQASSLMDSYRVFDEVIGFRSEAYVISLQWLTFDYLTPDDSGNRSIQAKMILSLGPSTTSNWALNPTTARLSILRR